MTKSKKRSGNIIEEFMNDPDYQNVQPIPNEDVLANQVQMYRDGDDSLRRELIMAHLHMVAAMAGDNSKRRNREDVMGVAMLALVDAVERAQTALVDNNITPYITAVVKDQIKEFVATDRAVGMPARTFRHKIANGTLKFNDRDEPIGLPSTLSIQDELVNHHGYTVPAATPEFLSPEFKEAMQLAITNGTERTVIDLCAEGYRYTDMETALGLKKSQIGNILHDVEERFFKIYA